MFKIVRSGYGQIIVEFAVMCSVFLLITLGAIDYGVYMYSRYNIEAAVRNAGRYAIRERDWSDIDANETVIKGLITTYLDDISEGHFAGIENYVSVNITYAGSLIQDVSVGVADYPYEPLLGFGDFFIPPKISSAVTMRFQ